MVKNEFMESESKIYRFKELPVMNIADGSEPEIIDVSTVIGNVFYNQTNDIKMIDKAKEIYYSGETTFNENEAKHFLDVIINTPLIVAPVKLAIKTMFNKR